MLEMEGQFGKPRRSNKKKTSRTRKRRWPINHQLAPSPVASVAAPLLYKDDIIKGLRTQIKQQQKIKQYSSTSAFMK
jgi:hypothetical protein